MWTILVTTSPGCSDTESPAEEVIEIDMTSLAAAAYLVVEVRPASYSADVQESGSLLEVETLGGANPTLVLHIGREYLFTNDTGAVHPLEFITGGATRNDDVVLLAQGDSKGSLENDLDIDWTEDGNTVRFRVTETLSQVLDRYRCGIPSHAAMRGSITY